MRDHGSVVDDVAKRVDRTQYIKVKNESGKWITMPTKSNGKNMTINLRQPTEEDLMALRAICIFPPMEKVTHKFIQRSRSALESFQIQVPRQDQLVSGEGQPITYPNVKPIIGKVKKSTDERREILTFPSDKVAEKNQEATTQLQIDPV